MTTDRFLLLRKDAERALRNIPFQFLEGKRVLLTGASGLIGTHFLAGLIYAQQQIGPQLSIHAIVHRTIPDHVKKVASEGLVIFHEGDLEDPGYLQELPVADIVIHAATYGQPGLFIAHQETTLKLNTLATFALLEKLTEGGRFLFVSTSEIYSGLTNPPFKEEQIGTTNTDHARACYIEAKRCGEAICNSYRGRGLQTKSARLSLAYGPGTRRGDRRVINSFIEKALCTGEIRLLDRGLALRTYCYVADAVEMMWQILFKGTQMVYNVGGISQTTIADLANLVGQTVGVPVYIPESDQSALPGAPDNVCLNISRFTNEFGLINFMPLNKGVERTVEWQRALYKEST